MDWKNLIATVAGTGMTQKQIAADVGCSSAYISSLAMGKRGVRVSYEIGVRLVALRDRCVASGSSHSQVLSAAESP